MTQAENILRELIRHKTISNTNNLLLVEFLEHHFSSLGFDTIRIMSPDEPSRANLLCHIGPDTKDGLMLSGHMDVVPVEHQNWSTDPFVLTKKDNKLFGRGVADMKGFIAATCSALSQVSLKTIKNPLSLLWTYDEEIGCIGSQLAAPQLKKYLHHQPGAALIGEPTNFSIVRMHSGHVTVTVQCQGKGAHSSNPDLGVSAIKVAHQALKGIFELEEELKKEHIFPEFFERPYTTMNVGQIHGGTAVNIVPDKATITLGFRPLPTISPENIYERIMVVAKKYQDNPSLITGHINRSTPSMITEPGTKLETIIKPLAENSTSPAAPFATDAGNLCQQGIPSLIFGPGSIDVAHKANEWIYEQDIEKASQKIKAIVEKWCST